MGLVQENYRLGMRMDPVLWYEDLYILVCSTSWPFLCTSLATWTRTSGLRFSDANVDGRETFAFASPAEASRAVKLHVGSTMVACCGTSGVLVILLLFIILIKYCHTRSININNKPECFSERLVLVLLYLSFWLFLYLCLVITGPYQGVFFSCCFLQIKPCI